MLTAGFAIPFHREVQLLTEFAHPANLLAGHADHQGIVGHILVDHGAGTHKRISADGYAANDGAVRPQRRAFLYQGIPVFILAFYQGPGVIHIGEHHAGPTEDTLFQMHVVVDRYVVLDLAIVANGDLVTDKDILAHGHVLADASATTNMHKMPDTGTCTNLCAVIHDSAGMQARMTPAGADHGYEPASVI